MASTEKSLLIRAKNGSEQAWEKMVEVYRPMIFHWLIQHDVVRQDAEDISQDILITMIERLSDFEHNGNPGAFRSWLRMMVVNRSRAFWRARGYRPKATGATDFHNMLKELEDPQSQLSGQWNQQHNEHVLRSVLRMLRNEFEQRTLHAFELVVMQGKTTKEAADALQMSVGAIYVARSRVLRRVREEVEGLIEY